MKNAILHARVVTRDAVLPDYGILYDENILQIAPSEQLSGYEHAIDAQGQYLIPGLIDVHIHGYHGHDVMDGTPAALQGISKGLLENGVTGFCPTTVTMSPEDTETAFQALREEMSHPPVGAEMLGVHMEGPYLALSRKGSHEPSLLTNPDRQTVLRHRDILRIITVAPELDFDFVSWAAEQGIIVSMGHSEATFEQASRAIESGARHITHLFNAMSGLTHQKPGVVGAALLHDGVEVELVADTIHVRKELFKLVYRMKGQHRILLITDCVRAGGMPPGDYTLGAMPILSDGQSVRLSNGTLAGSILRLNQGVANFCQHAGVPLHEAVLMASYNPALSLGVADRIGSIDIGKQANFALTDESMVPSATYMRGERKYQKERSNA